MTTGFLHAAGRRCPQPRRRPELRSHHSFGRALPDSINDFRLESTFGHPCVMPFSISEPASNWSCVTVRRTTVPTGSRSKVTLVCFSSCPSSAGKAQERTRRRGGELSITFPTSWTAPSFPSRRCSQREPGLPVGHVHVLPILCSHLGVDQRVPDLLWSRRNVGDVHELRLIHEGLLPTTS